MSSNRDVMKDVKAQLKYLTQSKGVLSELISHVKKHNVTPTAVFDLDATLITDREYPIRPMCEFMEWLHNYGVYCVVVTARPSDTYADTRLLMDTAIGGHGKWGFIKQIPLYCLPLEFVGIYTSKKQALRASEKDESVEDPVAIFKYMMRWMIHQTIGPLVIAVGDQTWDVQRYCSDTLGDEPNKYGIGTHKNEAEFIYMKLPNNVMKIWPPE